MITLDLDEVKGSYKNIEKEEAKVEESIEEVKVEESKEEAKVEESKEEESD